MSRAPVKIDVDPDVLEELDRRARPGESFSDTIRRTLGERREQRFDLLPDHVRQMVEPHQ